MRGGIRDNIMQHTTTHITTTFTHLSQYTHWMHHLFLPVLSCSPCCCSIHSPNTPYSSLSFRYALHCIQCPFTASAASLRARAIDRSSHVHTKKTTVRAGSAGTRARASTRCRARRWVRVKSRVGLRGGGWVRVRGAVWTRARGVGYGSFWG